uniref:Uncharacterized protein n=1 Tax=Tetradesmus obliquus TaxID=3088 RepID=A0A383VQN2_TETOB|eukprot:jgi/Sobl393_1/16443/SZX67825.1
MEALNAGDAETTADAATSAHLPAGAALAKQGMSAAFVLPAEQATSAEMQQFEQQDLAVLSPVSIPAAMLLPVQAGAAAGTSPQRLKYASDAAAYESDLEDELAGNFNSSMGISDSAALLQYSAEEHVLAAATAAAAADAARAEPLAQDVLEAVAASPDAPAEQCDASAALPSEPAVADETPQLTAQDVETLTAPATAAGVGTNQVGDGPPSPDTAADSQQQRAAAAPTAAPAAAGGGAAAAAAEPSATATASPAATNISAVTGVPAAPAGTNSPGGLSQRRRSRVGQVRTPQSSQPAAVSLAPQQRQQQQQPVPSTQAGQPQQLAGVTQSARGAAPWVPAAAQTSTAAAAAASNAQADSSLASELAKLRPIKTAATDAAADPGAPAAAAAAAAAGAAAAHPAASEGRVAGNISRAASLAEPAAAVMSPMYRKAACSSVLSLCIQRSTALVPDVLLTDPVVRLHVVHAGTGEYVRMVHQAAAAADAEQQQQQQQQQQQAVFGAAGPSWDGGASSGGMPGVMRQVVEASLQEKLLEHPGRPVLGTVDNNTPCPRPALLQYIPPIQTRPYDMLRGQSNGLAAEWGEELSLDVSPEGLAAADALLLLEVLQLPSGFARFKNHAQDFGPGGSGHAVAWAFLRLQGLRQQLLQGQPLQLQLQLYRYKPAAVGEPGMLSKGPAGPHPATPAKAAFLSWRGYGLDSSSSSSGSPGAPVTPGSPLRTALGSFWSTRACGPAAAAAADAAAGLPAQQQQQQQQQQLFGSLQQPQLPSSGSSSGRPLKGWEKYPGFLEVTLATKPRPSPEVLLVVTNPAAGVRPDVPAGYGSGFEHGRIPWALLHNPKAAAATAAAAASAQGAAAGGDVCGAALLDRQLLLLENQLHRPLAHPCKVPNAVLVDIPGSPGGCSCIASSRDGRWLAAAAVDADGRFKIVLYQALTGRLCWVLGSHAGMVYSITWARDDSSIITASADYTAKVWHLPLLPSPANASTHATLGGMSEMTGTAASSSSSSSVSCSVLQHKCFVYAAELHPVQQPLLLAVTGGYDGFVRVWSAADGQQLAALQVSGSPINCLALNQLGSRMFAGDAAGVLSELSVDVTPLSSSSLVPPQSAAAAAWAAAAAAGPAAYNGSSAAGGLTPESAGCDSPLRQQQQQQSLLSSLRPSTPMGQAAAAAAAAVAEAVSPVAAVLRHGSTASQLLAGCEVLKLLRNSSDLAGSSISSLAVHPGGHQLLALTKAARAKGSYTKCSRSSELVVVDMKLLLVARRMSGVRCSTAPLKFGFSPDGEYVTCGSESGPPAIWDFATATATPAPHFALGGAPVYCVAWNNCFHAVAVCSFSPYAPIRVLCFDPQQPQVALSPPQQHGAAAAAERKQRQAQAADPAAGLRPRYVLPDQLTPHHVHALLSDLRASAAQRGVYRQSNDPDGQHLVVKASGHNRHRHHNTAASASAAAAAAAQHNSKGPCRSNSQHSSHPHSPAPANRAAPVEGACSNGSAKGMEGSPPSSAGKRLQPAMEPCHSSDSEHSEAAGEGCTGLDEQQGELQCEGGSGVLQQPAGKGLLESIGEAARAAAERPQSAAAATGVGAVGVGAGGGVSAPNVAAGKNRQRALDRLQQAAAPNSSSSSSAGQPSTPKVVLNQKAAVAAPWLQ